MQQYINTYIKDYFYKVGDLECSGACLTQRNSDDGLDTLAVLQRRPLRPAPPVRALPVGLPRLLSAQLLLISPVILLRCIGVSDYASGASDEMTYDDHDFMQCR
jgi:hypothetical protein